LVTPGHGCVGRATGFINQVIHTTNLPPWRAQLV
jgi:hypothetical protein